MYPGTTHGESGATRAPIGACYACCAGAAGIDRTQRERARVDQATQYLMLHCTTYLVARSVSAVILIRPGPSLHPGISDAAHAITHSLSLGQLLPSAACPGKYLTDTNTDLPGGDAPELMCQQMNTRMDETNVKFMRIERATPAECASAPARRPPLALRPDARPQTCPIPSREVPHPPPPPQGPYSC